MDRFSPYLRSRIEWFLWKQKIKQIHYHLYLNQLYSFRINDLMETLILMRDFEIIRLTDQMVDKLFQMFRKIIYPFELYRKDRLNFLNPIYVIRKCLEIINPTNNYHHLKDYPCQSELADHDQIWFNICDYLGWINGH